MIDQRKEALVEGSWRNRLAGKLDHRVVIRADRQRQRSQNTQTDCRGSIALLQAIVILHRVDVQGTGAIRRFAGRADNVK